MKKNNLKNNKGLALLWAVVLSGLLLIICGTMVSFMIKENKMSINIEDSTQAYSYARTGIDWSKAFLRDSSGTDGNGSYNFDLKPQVAGDELTVIITGDLGNNTKVARSTGNYAGVKRTIEYKLTNSNWIGISANTYPYGTPLPVDNKGSFTFQFDFWTDFNGPIAKPLYADVPVMGLTATTDPRGNGYNPYISIAFADNLVFTTGAANNSGLILQAALGAAADGKFGKTEPLTVNTANNFVGVANDAEKNMPYRYRMVLSYISNTQASAKLLLRNSNDGSYTCGAYGILDVSGNDFGNLDKLLAHGAGYPETSYTYSGGPQGDGYYIRLPIDASHAYYIDNPVFKKN